MHIQFGDAVAYFAFVIFLGGIMTNDKFGVRHQTLGFRSTETIFFSPLIEDLCVNPALGPQRLVLAPVGEQKLLQHL